jgi:hypothetical protein
VKLLAFQAPKPEKTLRFALPVLAALLGLAAWQFGAQITAEELMFTSVRFRGAYWLLVAAAVLLALVSLAAWTRASKRLLRDLAAAQSLIDKLGDAAAALFFALLVAYPLVLFGFYGRFLLNPFPRLLVFALALLLATSLLAAWRREPWLQSLPAAALALSAVYCAATFFNQVSTYPFSLEWSEISRYYQASFYLSEKVYDVQLPLPVTHPSRYLLQSFPFLFSAPLWAHRLWQALLWVAMPLIAGWSLMRRFALGRWAWLAIAWSFLYLMQGAVFYHLLPCVFIVLLGFDRSRPWRSFAFVALASVWAGISRINWVPLPGALAVMLYLLEARPRQKQAPLSFDYLWPAALYSVGGSLIALGSYALYISLSGVAEVEQFGSSFTSALLWNRLLPNGEFRLGILLGIALVSAPLLALIWLRRSQRGAVLGAWRGLAIATLLLIFFAGGLVVSVKIGGGTNLHNMDAYMVLLWVLVAYAAFGAYKPAAAKPLPRLTLSSGWLAALLAAPILFAVLSGGPLGLPPRPVASDAFAQIKQLTESAAAAGGRVLFISQRHLLTFHMVDGIELEPNYEKLFLMEMAISNNEPYLARFHDSIDDQDFALIVTDPLYTAINDEAEDALAAENNAWVRQVSKPVLCAYEPVLTYAELGIQVLQPRLSKCAQ